MGAYSYGHERWKANQYGPRSDKKPRSNKGKELINVGSVGPMEIRGMAWAVTINDKQEYLPRSQVKVLENGTLMMPRWLAKKYGFAEIQKEV